jgi:triphosphatase
MSDTFGGQEVRKLMEIEAKYRITGNLTSKRITSFDMQPYLLRPDEDARHHDTLLDTHDRAITGSGYALRLREVDGRRILTLKGPPQGDGAFHQREELEADLDDALPEPRGKRKSSRADWPEPIASRVSDLIGDEPVRPLLHVDVHRRTWNVERAGQLVAELAYDVGVVKANEKSDEINELEVELKGVGVVADLHALDERLRALAPLEPEARTKLSRGLALLPRQRPDPGRRNLAELGKHTIAAALSKYYKREPDARAGEDPEGVHDVRVAIRRLRSALALLEEAPGFDDAILRRWRKRLKGLAAALGAVRDLDVQLEHVAAYLEANPQHRSGLQPVQRQMVRERAAARAAMLDALDERKTRDTLHALHDFASEKPQQGDDEDMILVRHFAGGAVWRRYEAVLRHECLLPTDSGSTLHELRIACKRLRYALEMFARAFGPDSAPLVAALVAVQDCLGAHQDCVVARGYLQRSREDSPDEPALTAYDEALEAEQVALRERFGRLWVRVSGRAFRRDLASLIAAL